MNGQGKLIANKIGLLRYERKERIREYENEMQKILDNRMFSEVYKKERIEELEDELRRYKADIQRQIEGSIQLGKKDVTKLYHSREIKPHEEIRELRQQMANRDLSDDLIEEYASSGNSHTDGMKLQELYNQAKHAVDNELPQAGAYIRAVKKLFKNKESIQDLVSKHEENIKTPEQKILEAEFGHIESEERVFESDLLREKFYAGGLSTVESIGIKRRLHELGEVI